MTRPLICVSVLLLPLLASLFIAPAGADIAPARVEFGSSLVLTEQENVSMEAFYVNVTIVFPTMYENYTYHMRNLADTSVNQTVVIPVFWGRYLDYRIDTYQAYCNGHALDSSFGMVRIGDGEDLDILGFSSLDDNAYRDSDLPEDQVAGFIANITLPVDSVSVITMCMSSTPYEDDYTGQFTYTYSAKTARFWNGTINEGHFRFEYIGGLDGMTYDVPEGQKSGNVVTSDMTDWDGDADYVVVVHTNVHYHHVGPEPTPEVAAWAILCILGGVVAFVAVLVVALVVIVIVVVKRKNRSATAKR